LPVAFIPTGTHAENNPSRDVPFWHLADQVLSWINV